MLTKSGAFQYENESNEHTGQAFSSSEYFFHQYNW